MKLSSLLSVLTYNKINSQKRFEEFADNEITYICSDSRRAHRSCIFVCIEGAHFDGHEFAKSAHQKGARVIITQKPLPDIPYDTLVITVDDTRRALALLVCEIYRHPDRRMCVIGITGTKGKTTTALLIKNVLDRCEKPCGYIGTNGIIYKDRRIDTENTTPDISVTCEALSEMERCGVRYVVIEVSSQALWQDRIFGIKFDVCIFTNISEDHIGGFEHPSYEHYMSCKSRLFTEYSPKHIIYNLDEKDFASVFSGCTSSVLHPYSIRSEEGLFAKNIQLYRDRESFGVSFECFKKSKRFPERLSSFNVSLKTPGEFSVYNALATTALCRLIGIDTASIKHALALAQVEGRFETVHLESKPGVMFVIDYAHNALSLTSVLKTLREYPHKRIITLFGSVGGRTHGRREELGRVASQLSDYSILTADNPNHEPVLMITADIKRPFDKSGLSAKYEEIPDRGDAIRRAYEIAEDGDIVLLAGKGHERYQLIDGQRIVFSEREILKALDVESRELLLHT